MDGSVDTIHGRLARLAAERHGDPARALTDVDHVLDDDAAPHDVRARARWIRGLLLHELARPGEAVVEFERAIETSTVTSSDDAGSVDAATIDAAVGRAAVGRGAVGLDVAATHAWAHAGLAVAVAQIGDTARAEHEIATARRLAPPEAQGLVAHFAAVVTQRRGSHRDALTAYAEALPLLERAGDRASIGVLHLNRSIALGYIGDFRAARRELSLVEDVAAELGLVALAAMAAHNVGFVEGRRGRLADALHALDRAEAAYLQLSQPSRHLPVLFVDRAEILLVAGLATDARRSAQRAVEHLPAETQLVERTEAQLLLARACMAEGDVAAASQAAASAAAGFRRSRRRAWVYRAVFVARQAQLAGARSERLGRRFARLAHRLAGSGWPVEAKDAFVHGALAVAATSPGTATVYLHAARRLRAPVVPEQLARACHAHAVTTLADGHVADALRHLRRGVTIATRVVEQSGSTEATLEALRYASELAGEGVDLALRAGRPGDVLRWVERQRAVATEFPRVAGGADDERDDHRDVGDETARRERDLRRRRVSPRPSSSAPLDASVATAAAGDPRRAAFRWSDVRARLGERRLVYYVESGGALGALVVERRRTRFVSLGALAAVRDQCEFTHFALTSFTVNQRDDAGRAAARLARELHTLDAMVVAPLGVGRADLVVVPSPVVRRVPWSIVPSLAGVDVTIAPSAARWLAGARRHTEAPATGTARVVLVAGPRLGFAEAEVAHLQTRYPEAIVLAGDAARRGGVLDAIDGADLVHVAAHGLLRVDSPMFSHLELADGNLTVYDLERLRSAPRVVVLSACEAAAARLYPSGGALGTAHALLGLGTACVVAPLLVVEDRDAHDHMVAFHRHLSDGAAPASALRFATATAVASGDRGRLAAASSFVTIGAS